MANQLLASDTGQQTELDPSTTALFAHIKQCQA
jgi:glucose-6-phosphate isomerase